MVHAGHAEADSGPEYIKDWYLLQPRLQIISAYKKIKIKKNKAIPHPS